MALTAAELRAVLGVDMGTSLRDIDSFQSRLVGVGTAASRSSSPLRRLGGGLKSIGMQAAGFATGMLAFQGLSGITNTLTDSIIGMNSTLETSTLQFATLMGSTKRAEKHVKSLFEFAKRTPFETGPIITASRYLQTFGGDALNTEKQLTMVGDAAAATSAQFDEVAFWTGRMYSAMQSGKPFGEALARFQELGIMSPKARIELEKLQEEGAGLSTMWAVVERDMGRFTGSMEKQAGTWSGLTSTLADTIGLTLADAFSGVFEKLKEGVATVTDFLAQPAVKEALTALATGLVDGVGAAITTIGAIVSKVGPVLIGLLEAAQPVVDFFVNDLGPKAVGAIQRVINVGADIGTGITEGLGNLQTWWDEHGQKVMDSLAGAWRDVETAIYPVRDAINQVILALSSAPSGEGEEGGGFLGDLQTALQGADEDLGGLVVDLNTFFGTSYGTPDIDWMTFNGSIADAQGTVSGFAGAWEMAMDAIGPATQVGMAAFAGASLPIIAIVSAGWAVVESGLKAIGPTLEWLGTIWDSTVGAIVDLMNGDFAGAFANIKTIADTTLTGLGDLWDGFWETAQAAVDGFSTGITETWTYIDTQITSVMNSLGASWAEGWAGMKTSVVNAFNGIVRIVQNVISTIISAWNSLDFSIDFGEFVIAEGWKGVPFVPDLPRIVIGPVHTGDLIPDIGGGAARPYHFSRGTGFVPADMMGVLHKGEMVVPRPFAEGMREALRGNDGGGGVTLTTDEANRLGYIEHVHRLDADTSAGLREAGFDEERLAALLSAAARTATDRYRWAG